MKRIKKKNRKNQRFTPSGVGDTRCLLCLLDRDVDLETMLQHTWHYEPMLHDVLGMQRNMVSIDVDQEDPSKPKQKKSYDIDVR